jgi:hypothetical protein
MKFTAICPITSLVNILVRLRNVTITPDRLEKINQMPSRSHERWDLCEVLHSSIMPINFQQECELILIQPTIKRPVELNARSFTRETRSLSNGQKAGRRNVSCQGHCSWCSEHENITGMRHIPQCVCTRAWKASIGLYSRTCSEGASAARFDVEAATSGRNRC